MWGDNCPVFKKTIFCKGAKVGSSAPGGQLEQRWWEPPCSESALWLHGLCAWMSRNSKIKVVGAILTPWCPCAEGQVGHALLHLHLALFP